MAQNNDDKGGGLLIFAGLAVAVIALLHRQPPSVELGSLQGTIVDAGSQAAISGATIQLNGKTASSDASGFFTIDNIQPGEYTVVVSKEGYDTRTF